jgi:hypothetical protein
MPARSGKQIPSVSKKQRRLMGAAEHGADFPMAKKVRASMTKGQMHDFAKTKEKGLPEKKHKKKDKMSFKPESLRFQPKSKRY